MLELYTAENITEFITGVAIITIDDRLWSLPKPYRQHDLVTYIKNNTEYQSFFIKEQGFTTNKRSFVDRYSAMIIAEKSGELLPHKKKGLLLLSEFLW